MKKCVVLFLLFSGCISTESISTVDINKSFPHNEIQRIAVIMFEMPIEDKEDSRHNSKSAVSPDAGNVLADMTSRELTKWGRYVVVDRIAIEKDLKLKNLGEEYLHAEDYLSLGTSLGVDAIVVGKVEDFGLSYKSLSSGLVISIITKVSFTARCVDVTTNETIWTLDIKGTSKEDNERVLASELITNAIKTLKTKLN